MIRLSSIENCSQEEDEDRYKGGEEEENTVLNSFMRANNEESIGIDK